MSTIKISKDLQLPIPRNTEEAAIFYELRKAHSEIVSALDAMVNGTLVKGSILFVGDSEVIDQDNSNLFWDNANNRLGIGTNSPTAKVHIAAGGTAANSAPLKLTSQASPLTNVEQGAFELIGNSLQFSQLVKRRGVVMSQDVITSTTTIENTTSESAALITAQHGAGYLEVGKCEEIVLRGVIRQRANPSAVLSIRVKYAGVTIQTITTPASTVINAGTPYEVRVSATCRSVGATGTLQLNSVLWIDGVSNIPDSSTLVTIDTTTSQNTTITAQWGEANASNIFTVNQGRILCIEPNR